MKREPSSLTQDNMEQWIKYLVQRDAEHQKKIEQLTAEVDEINKKMHILGRSVLKLYRVH
ncbi:hypothetical protein HY639_02965 [Candidatus Woesearchaeota archaeon]|nr:hypothetical protein [Candidatus Woesearchaeota archaeon]